MELAHREINTCLNSFSVTCIFSLGTQSFSFLLSYHCCTVPYLKTNTSTCIYFKWEYFLFFQAMLNPAWLGHSNPCSQHWRSIISNNNIKLSSTESHLTSLLALLSKEDTRNSTNTKRNTNGPITATCYALSWRTNSFSGQSLVQQTSLGREGKCLTRTLEYTGWEWFFKFC